jgi:hypothetical protein
VPAGDDSEIGPAKLGSGSLKAGGALTTFTGLVDSSAAEGDLDGLRGVFASAFFFAGPFDEQETGLPCLALTALHFFFLAGFREACAALERVCEAPERSALAACELALGAKASNSADSAAKRCANLAMDDWDTCMGDVLDPQACTCCSCVSVECSIALSTVAARCWRTGALAWTFVWAPRGVFRNSPAVPKRGM